MRPGLLLSTVAMMCCCFAFAQPGPKMLAKSRWGYPSGPQYSVIDSVTYTHSASRNSIAAPVVVGWYWQNTHERYDTSVWYKRNYNTGVLEEKLHQQRVYTSFDSVAEHQVQQLNPTTQNWEPWTRIRWTYNTNHAVDTMLEEAYNPSTGSYYYLTRTEYNYAGSQLRRAHRQNWASGAWYNEARDSFYYDQNGRDSIKVSGTWPNGIYEENFRTIYQYDANGRKIRDTIYIDGVLNAYNGYRHDANGRLAGDSILYWDVTPPQWQTGDKNVYDYDTKGNMTRKTLWRWNNAANMHYEFRRTHFGYNSVNQLTKVEIETFLNNVWNKGETLFYYYDGPVQVSGIRSDETLQLYPVPAVAYITIDLNFKTPQDFTVSLYDMNGRSVMQWSETAQQRYVKQVPLTGLPAGNYQVHVSTNGGQLVKSFVVVH